MVGGRRLVFLVGGVMGPGTISGPIRGWKFCLSCSYEARPRDFLGGKCKANAIMVRLSEAQTSCVLPTSFSFFLSSINLFLLAI